MKTNFLANLLIVLALGLCGLCTFQWLRETDGRKVVQELHDKKFKLESNVQDYTNQIHHMDARIAEMTEDISKLRSTVKTNENVILELRREKSSLISTNDLLAKQLDAYTNAFAQAQEKLKEAYDNIRKQGEAVKEAIKQRDEFVQRLNDTIKERNELVGKFNELAKNYEDLQTAAQKLQAKKQ